MAKKKEVVIIDFSDKKQKDDNKEEDITHVIKDEEEVKERQQMSLDNHKNELPTEITKQNDLFEKYYNTSDMFHEYLVDGATLKCTQATVEDFDLNGLKIKLGTRLRTPESDDIRCQTVLKVSENPMSLNKLRYATVKDTIKNENILLFLCNCKLSVDKKWEEQRIYRNTDYCEMYGVCECLMELSDEWDNMPLEGDKRYMSKTDMVTEGQANTGTVDRAPKVTEGITINYPSKNQIKNGNFDDSTIKIVALYYYILNFFRGCFVIRISLCFDIATWVYISVILMELCPNIS